MTKNDPFSSNKADLGTGDAYGYDMQGATENLLYQSANRQPCYVCGNTAQYQILAKKSEFNTAQVQNGLYICNHDLSLAPINPKNYGIRELK
jgi:hypothetical protein